MKQVEVRIMGQNYLLGCAEGAEQELLDAVQAVDKEMCDIRDGGKLRARERIAVLAALNIALLAAKSNSVPNNTVQNTPLTTPSSNLDSTQIDEKFTDLINRIDDVLAEDGQLL